MLAKVFSSAVLGIDGYLVEVEVDLASGLPSFAIVGLPDASVKESRERVKAAVHNSGLDFPIRRITVNLSTAVSSRSRGPSLSPWRPARRGWSACSCPATTPPKRR